MLVEKYKVVHCETRSYLSESSTLMMMLMMLMFVQKEMEMKYVEVLMIPNNSLNHMMNNLWVMIEHCLLSMGDDFGIKVYRDHYESIHCLGDRNEQQLIVDFLLAMHGYRV